MLLSPGHSPRHLSTPSPSHSLSSADPPFSSSSQQQNPPKKSATVLDEDSYVAAIEKIIERDFFPDIPKLRDRIDWLEAVNTRDPVQIRDAQLKILERRRGLNPTDGGKIRTPGSTFFKNSVTPFDFDRTPSVIDGNLGGGEVVGDGNSVNVNLSLDQFFRKYTSEDNDSFNRIMEKVNRKRKERYGYLLEGEKEEDDEVKGIEDVKRDRITDGYGTSDQPVSTLEGWKYCAKNLLMYHPADRGEAPLTADERAERLKGLTKEVDRYNTRFHGKMSDSGPKEENEVEVLYNMVAGGTPVMSDRNRDKTKKYDLEDLRKSPNVFYVESEKKAENGYSFVKTPSPAPGGDESPFITWGEIEGTPLLKAPASPGVEASTKPPITATDASLPAPMPTSVPTPSISSVPESDVGGQAASNLVVGNEHENTIQHILDMGGGIWDRDTVVHALRAASNNPEIAVEYLYSGIPEKSEKPSLVQSIGTRQRTNTSSVTQQPRRPASVLSGGPNAGPLNTFPQGLPTVGSSAAPSGALDFLRNSEQFQALRAMVQANPQVLQPMLQEFGKHNPNVMKLIQEHETEFHRLLNEPIGVEKGNILEQFATAMPQAVQVTAGEHAAIERLEAMGFDRSTVLEAYFACNKNEELTANYLLDHMHDF